MYHTPVLLEPTLDYLALQPGARVIDTTLGDGGHTAAILAIIGHKGRVMGIDASPLSLERARSRLEPWHRQITLVNGNFGEMAALAEANQFSPVDAILMDLGLASWQLDEPALGLSFQRDEPLDMRLDPRQQVTAQSILTNTRPDELVELFERYGDLHRARPLVERIVAARRDQNLATTTDLVRIIGSRSPKVLAPIFQALRIAVNDELRILEQALEQALALIQPTGRLVVISYHSGEDRIVKTAFRRFATEGQATILTPKPIIATESERRANPRSRSAKLRALTASISK